MAQETFEQTQRRLGLGPDSASGRASTFPPTPPPVKRRFPARALAVVAGLAVLGVAGYTVSQALPAPGPVVDEWTAYPGSAFWSGDEILAQDSLEATRFESDALLAELMDAL